MAPFLYPKTNTNERWWCMARAPDARMEQARNLFLEGKKLIEISDVLKIPEGTIRSWKNRYDWDNATLQKKKRNVAKKKGGQPGNKNAAGNRGGSAPEKNKNAVTTGEFETLLFDCLDLEEQRLAQAVPKDKQALLMQEIQLLTVRERRMLKRIELLRSAADEENKLAVGETGMTAVGHKKGLEKDKETDLLEYRGKLGQIQNIEDALTRVQARKQAAIDALHRYGVDDTRLEIEAKRLEMAARKSGDLDEEEQEDDGFLEALDSSAADDWRNDESLKENAENEEETSNI